MNGSHRLEWAESGGRFESETNEGTYVIKEAEFIGQYGYGLALKHKNGVYVWMCWNRTASWCMQFAENRELLKGEIK